MIRLQRLYTGATIRGMRSSISPLANRDLSDRFKRTRLHRLKSSTTTTTATNTTPPTPTICSTTSTSEEESLSASSIRHLSPAEGASEDSPLTKSRRTMRSGVKAYIELAKPELSALVITTGTWGFLLTGCDSLVAGASTVAGLVLSAASAASWNQTSEAEYDKLMVRTRTRPIPSKRLTVKQAATFSLTTGLGGVSLLTLGANPLTGLLGFTNILLYGLAYTPMKRMTPFNTHVGAVVGGLPVVIGWTGGGGELVAFEPAVLMSILFAWQFPHFMGIAWKYRKDYKGAGYQMVTRDDPGATRTSYWATCGAVSLCAIPFVSYGVGMTSSMFIVSSAIPNAALMYSCFRFSRKPSGRTANRVILVGFVHLMVFLGLMFFHSTSEALDRHLNSLRNILRRVGKQLCIHETKMIQSPEMCPVPATPEAEHLAAAADSLSSKETLRPPTSSLSSSS
uniref:Protoheme IX farnesyltransferase, mitochondrial n=1 Tax=Norrisiella sphaerica TaxID=552664 RepID=A0A7S2QTQ1_9EUKA|mmetsp:Transcript_755/g.1116  ORF Transcript_755/g.1116 Transcript_755/m.1116 type:complete len:453 (+) Transcript_755:183-1541(+)|eukprot:CAMPEP_0184490962 /NCGR_PEP_ID=MMETSP0113_2-20130426/19283_1 /TAXON_ID=91329 /ORGANISM="Norrisiella sphaerica, Strain BC52" /LENGTH=452 /DNA_ID=CAMNT_0026875107 /DNA_START=112 /DNA_END=1470 /DNA_ORIENTATION=-